MNEYKIQRNERDNWEIIHVATGQGYSVPLRMFVDPRYNDVSEFTYRCDAVICLYRIEEGSI